MAQHFILVCINPTSPWSLLLFFCLSDVFQPRLCVSLWSQLQPIFLPPHQPEFKACLFTKIESLLETPEILIRNQMWLLGAACLSSRLILRGRWQNEKCVSQTSLGCNEAFRQAGFCQSSESTLIASRFPIHWWHTLRLPTSGHVLFQPPGIPCLPAIPSSQISQTEMKYAACLKEDCGHRICKFSRLSNPALQTNSSFQGPNGPGWGFRSSFLGSAKTTHYSHCS